MILPNLGFKRTKLKQVSNTGIWKCNSIVFFFGTSVKPQISMRLANVKQTSPNLHLYNVCSPQVNLFEPPFILSPFQISRIIHVTSSIRGITNLWLVSNNRQELPPVRSGKCICVANKWHKNMHQRSTWIGGKKRVNGTFYLRRGTITTCQHTGLMNCGHTPRSDHDRYRSAG